MWMGMVGLMAMCRVEQGLGAVLMKHMAMLLSKTWLH
jgi:hypothetical protein